MIEACLTGEKRCVRVSASCYVERVEKGCWYVLHKLRHTNAGRDQVLHAVRGAYVHADAGERNAFGSSFAPAADIRRGAPSDRARRFLCVALCQRVSSDSASAFADSSPAASAAPVQSDLCRAASKRLSAFSC